MDDVTRILSDIEQGDRQAAERLLPLVYDELRRLAAQKLARERAGLTLQATALVHEAYLRLVGGGAADGRWDGRGHFFAAAAEAMRRILVDDARRKGAIKHGGRLRRVEAGHLEQLPASDSPVDLLALDEALERLARESPLRAELVKLRFFAGLTMPEVAATLGISLAAAERHWTYARARLFAELSGEDPADRPRTPAAGNSSRAEGTGRDFSH